MAAKQVDDKLAYKYAQIKTDLSVQILEGQLRPHDRIPSLNEIVLRYKVSKITARRVLNDLVTEGLVYASRGRGSFVADRTAREVAAGRGSARKTLGVVFEHAAGSFMSDIIAGIDEEAYSRDVQITLSLSNNSYEREAENLERLTRMGVDKILLFMVLRGDAQALNPNVPLYLRLQDQGIRILLLACNLPGVQVPSITYDDYNAYRRLVKHLGDRGARRLAYVSRYDNASTTADRLRAFKDGLLENALQYEPARIVNVRMTSAESIVSDTARQFAEFLRKQSDIDAIVCSDEMVAAGVFDALETTKGSRRKRPVVGGMGSNRNLHVLKGNPYILLEDDTHRLGREAAAMILRNELPGRDQDNSQLFHRVISVPLRVPRALR